jgi:hypothetical protein
MTNTPSLATSRHEAAATLKRVEQSFDALRLAAAKRAILAAYPDVLIVNHRIALQPHEPYTAAHVAIERPNGYTVHLVLGGNLGARVDSITFVTTWHERQQRAQTQAREMGMTSR